MATRKKRDPHLARIREFLESEYVSRHPRAKIDAYRYNPASVRVRIIDPDFASTGRVDRNENLWTLLQELPEETRGEINFLLLLTPGETRESLSNLEFEQPTPSRV